MPTAKVAMRVQRTGPAGDAKIDKLPALRLQHPEHVAWLQVAVHHRRAVQAHQLAREVKEHIENGGTRAWRYKPLCEADAALQD